MLLCIPAVIGQGEITLTLFRSPDTLTLLVPGDAPANLQGLRFEATTAAGVTLLQRLEEFPSFRGLPYHRLPTPLCFHLTRADASVPLPLECQTVTTLTQTLVDANVFWYDLSARTERTLLITQGETTRLCPAGQAQCDFNFPPVTQPDTSTVTSLSPVIRNEDWTPVIQDFDGVEIVLVPPGCFMMGGTAYEHEQPIHEICFNVPFWIDRYEVTNGQFAQFNGVAANESYWKDSERPRETIDWSEARDFCDARDGFMDDAGAEVIRLPTEAEWEYAARGPSNWIYPWGNEFVPNNVVYGENSNGQSANVGSRPTGASWVGALDLSGNVWEWVSTIYGIDDGDYDFSDADERRLTYPYDDADGREQETDDPLFVRVLRGGSWDNSYDGNFRGADRGWNSPELRYNSDGFRCARDYDE
jgi:formylglycine-generating enzyme required for sulfatase activity